jgi:hypothetical protein
MKRIILSMLTVGVVSLFTGCSSSSSAPMPPQTPDFKSGMNDGCTTATGEYIKDSEMFRTNSEYHEGWFYGRKKCNPSDSKK